ncbi:GLYCEROL-3-PHOSPHATE O-ACYLTRANSFERASE 1 [Ceraceosorus bombacis]|uniref:GLYCEROL-3-PHOSPHATE O-ACYLTRANSFERASE 1 n=1 Tax=Ceraceosorus bombacis TaxID=401625 RepID=A0A0P1BM72_9BASI|nr:GLYCEROL-3-PHOSPHATE O-ACYLTRANSFERASE 1 [Ceraceosorus bombacis]
MATNIAFDIALLFWRIVINVFFRSIQPRGAWKIPRPNEGPVIFVAAPHHNQFLDPLLLASEVRRGSGRRVAFLIAEKSIKRQFIGAAARVMQSIPVARAADSAKVGKGTISAHSSGDATLIQGHGSEFTKQLKGKSQIMLPKSTNYATAEVVEVISDTELRIKKEFKEAKALESLRGKSMVKIGKGAKAREEEQQGCEYKCLPYVDQTQMYSSVYERLADGGSLGIFPEGGSHDRTDLLPLKAGVVIMALGAMAANPGLKVRIVPVGLSYFHPHKFRSRAVVEFGTPLDVPRELVGQFEKGGDGKREAVASMMDIVFDGLKSVTLRAPDYETLMFIQAGRRLYTPPGVHPSLSQVVEINRRMIVGYLKFKDDPRIQQLKANVLRYNKMLAYAGLKDHQVERATRAGWRSLGLFFYRLGLLGLWGGLALPGVVLNAPIIILAKIISARKAKEALAASQVKLMGRDVLATWKVLVSMGITPVLYCFYAGVATYVAYRNGVSPSHLRRTPLYVLGGMPMLAYSTLKFSEVGIDIYKSLPPLFVSLLPGNQKAILELQATRSKISAELHEVIDKLAPQVWDDFTERRIISPPTANAPPSTTPDRANALLWKQKTTDKRLDGTSALAHPLSWVDERLFGWSGSSRRASRTTRALSGAEFFKEGDEVVEEALSDGEDVYSSATEEESEEGDYEAIFSILSGTRSDDPKSPKSPRARTRSRASSGAAETFAEKRNRSSSDLQRLSGAPAMTPSASQSPQKRSTALPERSNGAQQRRTRTHSLMEDVSATDLAGPVGQSQRHADFKDAAAKLEESAEQRHEANGDPKRPLVRDMESAAPTPGTATPR